LVIDKHYVCLYWDAGASVCVRLDDSQCAIL
jgi:hypothetical protein